MYPSWCRAPSCLPSLSSSSEGPAVAPPPPHFGPFFSSKPPFEGAGISFCPGAQSRWRRFKHTAVTHGLRIPMWDTLTSIPFSSTMADFLFSPPWSCKNNSRIGGQGITAESWETEHKQAGRLTVHELSSSCEQSQNNETLLWNKKLLSF